MDERGDVASMEGEEEPVQVEGVNPPNGEGFAMTRGVFEQIAGQATTIHTAAQSNDVDLIRHFLDREGADVNAPDSPSTKWTPLHYAANHGQDAAIAFLLKNGADINARDHAWNTPLHLAAQDGRDGVISELLDRDADVNAQNSDGLTPLHLAAQDGRDGVISKLLYRGADVNAQNSDGLTPLHIAVMHGQNNTINLLVNRDADVNVQDSTGQTPLHIAANRDQHETIQLLLSCDRSPDARDDWWAPLHLDDNHGKTPLHLVIEHGNDNTAIGLLSYPRANVNVQKKKDRKSLFHTASKKGTTNVIYLLHAREAFINVKDKNGYTPLHIADKCCKNNARELLTRCGAMINPPSKYKPGNTPLHTFAKKGKVKEVKWILSRVVAVALEVNVQNDKGKTPLDLAISAHAATSNQGKKGKIIKIIKLLLKRGVVLDTNDEGLREVIRLVNEATAPNIAAARAEDLLGQAARLLINNRQQAESLVNANIQQAV
ncbi:MAG: ankyrin repeat domain-containing protein [Bacteroidota bacterium]